MSTQDILTLFRTTEPDKQGYYRLEPIPDAVFKVRSDYDLWILKDLLLYYNDNPKCLLTKVMIFKFKEFLESIHIKEFKHHRFPKRIQICFKRNDLFDLCQRIDLLLFHQTPWYSFYVLPVVVKNNKLELDEEGLLSRGIPIPEN